MIKQFRLFINGFKRIKMISFDGGGLRGYFPAYFLNQLEKEYKIDLFKWANTFAGTSTGALLSLSAYFNADKKTILDLYENGKKNFLVRNSHLLPTFEEGLYKNDNILKYITKYTQDKTMSQLKGKNLIFCSTLVAPFEKVVFGNNGLSNSNIPANMATLSSTTVPFVFPSLENKWVVNDSKKIEGKTFLLDGGLWATDPTSAAIEKLVTKGYKIKNIKVLSFATMGPVEVKSFFAKIVDRIKKYLKQVDSKLDQDDYISKLNKNNYQRINMDFSKKSSGFLELTEEFKELSKKTYNDKKEEVIKFLKSK